MQKSKLIIIVSVVFLIIVVLYFLYLSKLNSQTQPVSNNQTVSDSQPNIPADNSQKTELIPSDWKVYQNKDLGFSIDYPSDWMEKDNTLSYLPKGANFVSPQTWDNAQANRKALEEYYGASLEDSFNHLSGISINRYASIKEAHGEDSIENVIKNNSEVKKVGEIKVDGTNAVETIMSGEFAIYVIMFENKGYYYEIKMEGIENKESVPTIQKQMISSFRFLN